MTLSAYVKPRLLSLNEELGLAVPRVVAGDDGEAVHDLRVALRKLRSVLRVVRRLYGRFHSDAVRAGFKRVADATGALRDEEVLAETLSALELTPRSREPLATWLRARHARRERKLRRDVVALVGGGALEAPSAMLAALLTLPVDPSRDRPAARFARKVVFGALDDIERAQPVDPTNAPRLHELRILYKRLRYAIDTFAGVLPPEFAALERAAAAFQKRLGTVHDLDVALDVTEGAEGLPAEISAEIFEALTKERARQVEKFERERVRGVSSEKEASDRSREEKAALKHAALKGASLELTSRKDDSRKDASLKGAVLKSAPKSAPPPASRRSRNGGASAPKAANGRTEAASAPKAANGRSEAASAPKAANGRSEAPSAPKAANGRAEAPRPASRASSGLRRARPRSSAKAPAA